MPRTLYLLRHAKSSWDDASLSDHDRPLNKRGYRDAPRLGAWMAANDHRPQHILTSTAERARTTAHLVLEHLEAAITEHPDLYHAAPRAMFDVLTGCDDANRSAMVVAHNPGLEDCIELLTGAWERMPTAALAQIDLPIDAWSDVLEVRGARLVDVWRPKELW